MELSQDNTLARHFDICSDGPVFKVVIALIHPSKHWEVIITVQNDSLVICVGF